jgi:serine/threonine protein kinase
VFDAGQVGGELFLAMDFVEGKDLRAVWNRCAKKAVAFPVDVAAYIVKELCRGLAYAHSYQDLKLVHRDVSPPNVLISFTGEVKLTDFGLARMLQGAKTVGASARAGTPGYMSPEQAFGEDLDGRSDLYAVGIVLWELLASERLRAGPPGDVRATITFPAIRRPSADRPVPADLEAVAMRLLAYRPQGRYPTAELAAHALLRCRAAPRDGRGDLVRLLDERFPRPRSPGPLVHLLEPSSPSQGTRTITES